MRLKLHKTLKQQKQIAIIIVRNSLAITYKHLPPQNKLHRVEIEREE